MKAIKTIELSKLADKELVESMAQELEGSYHQMESGSQWPARFASAGGKSAPRWSNRFVAAGPKSAPSRD